MCDANALLLLSLWGGDTHLSVWARSLCRRKWLHTAWMTMFSILDLMLPDTIQCNSFCLQSLHNTNADHRNSFASGIDSSQRPRQKNPKQPKHCSAYLFFKAVTAQVHTQLKQRVSCTTKMRIILISLKVNAKLS